MSDTQHSQLKFVPYVPRGFEGPTVDVVDALKRGRAVLVEEEDRWIQEVWFENDHPEIDIQDPYCNSWRVCAEGAVLIVTVGLHNQTLFNSPQNAAEVAACPWECFTDFEDDNSELWGAQDLGQRQLYGEAVDLLASVGAIIYRRSLGVSSRKAASANYFNDFFFNTRDEAIAWFDETITVAEG